MLDYRQALGDRIREMRQQRNLTQERVFLAVGIPRTTYQGIERGQSDPVLSDLLLIARRLGVPLAELVDTEAASDGSG